MNHKPTAFALGLRRSASGHTLDVLYPEIVSDTDLLSRLLSALEVDLADSSALWIDIAEHQYAELSTCWQDAPGGLLLNPLVAEGMTPPAYGTMDLGLFVLQAGEHAVDSAEEAYFKLQMLSQRLVQPHGVCLDKAFAALTNVAWTQKGPILPADLPVQRLKAQLAGEPLVVSHIDKFPYLVNYHVPSGVRIAAGAQVRLGAHLGEGTTVMPAGYVNFNAGTAGNAMIEGRVSAGVFVGHDSDVGGGASIMGTLSGGNDRIIAIGENCLLGANAGLGISLGKGCTVAAGLYVYGGMKVALVNANDEPIDLDGHRVAPAQNIFKAAALSGRDHLLFIQDSRTGQVICKPNAKSIALNAELHSHN